MVLILGWFYFWGGLTSEVVLFLGWSYFWISLISGLVLFLGWSYYWGGLFCGGLISGVVLRCGSTVDRLTVIPSVTFSSTYLPSQDGVVVAPV